MSKIIEVIGRWNLIMIGLGVVVPLFFSLVEYLSCIYYGSNFNFGDFWYMRMIIWAMAMLWTPRLPQANKSIRNVIKED